MASNPKLGKEVASGSNSRRWDHHECQGFKAYLIQPRGEGQQDIVLRQDIDEMKSSGVSLMPEGLEKDVPVEGMADLIAFLKGWRFIDAPERDKR